jgi:hypothetical protein
VPLLALVPNNPSSRRQPEPMDFAVEQDRVAANTALEASSAATDVRANAADIDTRASAAMVRTSTAMEQARHTATAALEDSAATALRHSIQVPPPLLHALPATATQAPYPSTPSGACVPPPTTAPVLCPDYCYVKPRSRNWIRSTDH